MEFLQNLTVYVGKIGLNVVRIFSVGVIVACFTTNPAAADPGEGTLFGLSGNTQKLLSIDPVTGVATVIGGTLGFPAPALARDPLTGILYAGQGGGNPSLYTVDATTGIATLVGNSGLGFAAIGSLEFDSNGVLFAAVNIAGDGGTGSDHLAIIETASGIATLLGPFGTCMGVTLPPPVNGLGSCTIEGIEGIAFDADGLLWGVHSARGLAGPAGLYRINPLNGAATFEGPLLDTTSNPASGGFVSMQFGCDGTTYLGSARAMGAATDGGTLATIEPGGLTSSPFTFATTASTAGSSLSALTFENKCAVVPGDDVVVLPRDPDEPVTAVVQEVIVPGTIKQFSGCVIEDDRGTAAIELDLVQKIKDTDTPDCNTVEAKLAEQGSSAAKLKNYQRAFEDPNDSNKKKISITLIESRNTAGEPDQLTKGVVVSEEDATKQGVTEPLCNTAKVSDSPSTVGINLSLNEPSMDKARNWTGTCNRTRSFGRFSDQLLAYPIRNDSAILSPHRQVHQEAGDLHRAIRVELAAGCVDHRFLHILQWKFNKAMFLVHFFRHRLQYGIRALNAATLFALDPDDNDPYGSCPNDPKGHLVSRFMDLTYHVHRGLRFPDTFVEFEIDQAILDELPPFPGDP